MAELDRRLVQLADDIEREQRLGGRRGGRARAARRRRGSTLRREAGRTKPQRASVDQRVARPTPRSRGGGAEKALPTLPATLADLTRRGATR